MQYDREVSQLHKCSYNVEIKSLQRSFSVGMSRAIVNLSYIQNFAYGLCILLIAFA